MKGYRTYLVGFLLAIGTPGLAYLSGLDWPSLVGPKSAVFISGLIMVVMRSITNTSPGQSS